MFFIRKHLTRKSQENPNRKPLQTDDCPSVFPFHYTQPLKFIPIPSPSPLLQLAPISFMYVTQKVEINICGKNLKCIRKIREENPFGKGNHTVIILLAPPFFLVFSSYKCCIPLTWGRRR